MKRAHLLLYLILVIMLAGCSSKIAGIDFQDALSPCEIDEQDIGARIKIGGLLEFVDSTAPDGWYADLERDRCRVGVWIPIENLKEWEPVNPDAYREGAVLIVEGYLSSQPLPARPEDFQLIVELDQPPQELIPGEVPNSQSTHQLPECNYEDSKTGEMISGKGTILVVEDSAAAGIYLELKEGNCFKRVWVERQFFDEWTQSEQKIIKAGNVISISGIYTLVRGEPTIDISEPPLLE